MNKKTLVSVISAAILAISTVAAFAESPQATVRLPLVQGWYDGQEVLYLQTEVSDQQLALQQGATFVPGLANAINAQPPAVDDIYHVTNFNQGNITASAPNPTGPNNRDTNYSPLWQVSVVTWKAGTTPHTLRSEAEVKASAADGLVTIEKTNIVVNCPIIFTPEGGLFPNAKSTLSHDRNEEGR